MNKDKEDSRAVFSRTDRKKRSKLCDFKSFSFFRFVSLFHDRVNFDVFFSRPGSRPEPKGKNKKKPKTGPKLMGAAFSRQCPGEPPPRMWFGKGGGRKQSGRESEKGAPRVGSAFLVDFFGSDKH